MYPERLPITRPTCTSRFYTEVGEISLLSPQEQFIDTNNAMDIEKWYLDNNHKKPLCSSNNAKPANSSHQADLQHLASHLSVYQTQEVSSISSNQLSTNGPLKEEDEMNPFLEDLDFKILPEEED